MTKYTAFFLVLLRLAIGWHFLAEGYHKLEGYWRGPTETVVGKAKPFSSAGYFREGTGPLAGIVRHYVGDPDAEALGRLEAPPKSGDSVASPPHTRMPPLLASEWSDYVKLLQRLLRVGRQATPGSGGKTATCRGCRSPLADQGRRGREDKGDQEDLPVQHRRGETADAAAHRGVQDQAERTARYDEQSPVPDGPRCRGPVACIETKGEVVRLRSALLADLDDYTKNLQKSLDGLLTEEQKQTAAQKDKEKEPAPAAEPPPNRVQKWIDLSTMYGLAILGACLVLGLFSRTACLLSAGFLLMTYLCVPPWPWLPVAPNTEGYYAFVNKNVIEMLALFALATTASGRWFGLDALIHAIFFGWRRPGTPPQSAPRV